MSTEPEIRVFYPDQQGIRQVLGELEAEIMELIWSRPPDEGTTVRDVFEVLYERRRLAYTTIQSTMTRLTKKRLLRVEKREQTYLYTPTLTQPEFIARFMGRVLEGVLTNLTGLSPEQLASRPGQETIEQARRLLEEITRRRASEEEEEDVPPSSR